MLGVSQKTSTPQRNLKLGESWCFLSLLSEHRATQSMARTEKAVTEKEMAPSGEMGDFHGGLMVDLPSRMVCSNDKKKREV